MNEERTGKCLRPMGHIRGLIEGSLNTCYKLKQSTLTVHGEIGQ